MPQKITSIDDLKKLRDQAKADVDLRSGPKEIQATVHMGTCGIAAGARDVMSALVKELSQADRQDIQVVTSGCIGRCESEPNVTVEIGGEDSVVYQKMTPEKIQQMFKKHILGGEVQEEFRLT